MARITTRGGRATGVVLESGEEIDASVVVSSVDADRSRSCGLLEPGALDPEFEAEVRRFKFRGSSGKVNLALDAPARLHAACPARASTCAARSPSRPSVD